jgi:HlyD family secretion protein
MLDAGVRGRDRLSYDTVPVTRGAIRRMVTTSGPVRALVTVSIGSQLSGQIDAVNVDFNSEVKPGDVLATVDAKTFTAKVSQARADLAVAKAALNNQQAALAKAEAVLKAAERNAARQQQLAAKGFAAQSQLDTAVRDSEVGQADIAVAKAQIESAKATIQQRRAQLAQAEIDLERTEIRSPIEGTVISRTVDPGQTVAASLQAPELFKIARDLSRIRIEAQVNEADVGAVKEGNPATFTVDAYPERKFEGRVTQVRLAATEINSVVTYTVIVESNNEERLLYPGMTANLVILTASRDGVLRVPNDAFRYKPRGAVEEASRQWGGADRLERIVEGLKTKVALTAAQEEAAKGAVAKLGAELREGTQGTFGAARPDFRDMRQRAVGRIDQALSPLLGDDQRAAYEEWKLEREAARPMALWVLGPGGVPERRHVRTGLTDDQFTEIAGGDLGEGDRVIVRAREARS